MSYAVHANIVASPGLRQRLTACAATQNVADPPRWVNAHAWFFPGADWVAAWESADENRPDEQDHGAHDDVITDQMILSAVQARM